MALKKNGNNMLRFYENQFEKLRSRYFDCTTSMERQKIRNKLVALLSQVEALGELGRQLGYGIKAFLEMPAKPDIPPCGERDSLADLINTREQKDIIVRLPARRKD